LPWWNNGREPASSRLGTRNSPILLPFRFFCYTASALGKNYPAKHVHNNLYPIQLPYFRATTVIVPQR
jgi:hypothetical protein